ncbi:hypothetical protein ACRBEV_29680 [Methylobacterium phyllosphaerae]
MTQTIFYSWQTDTSTLVGRNLIERALQLALKRIEADTELDEAVRELEIDRDTKGVAGTPPIVDTIFKKIDAATVFLPDLTFVGKRLDGRPTPNPNVLIEYGWALNSLTHGRMVPVMNTAFGEPKIEDMPFDMRHLRNPILYHCPVGASEDERRQSRDGLSKALEKAIRVVLASPELRREPQIVAPPAFVPHPTAGRPGFFRSAGEPLGIINHPYERSTEIRLEDGASMWLRVMPAFDQDKTWSIAELEKAAKQAPLLQPMNKGWGGYSWLQGHDGFGAFPTGSEGETYGVSYFFKTGEIWAIDTFVLEAAKIDGKKIIYLRERDFEDSVKEFGALLRQLGVTGPLKWMAGMDRVKGRGIELPTRSGYSRLGDSVRGACMLDVIEAEGLFDPETDQGGVLRKFFEIVYECCCLQRPSWLNNVPVPT